MASLLFRSFGLIRNAGCLSRPLQNACVHPTRMLSKFSPLLASDPDFTPRAVESDFIGSDAKTKTRVVSLINNLIEQSEEGRLFAVVQVCGKQFKVTNNDIIVIEGDWPPDVGDEIRLEKVLLLGSSNFTLVGRPVLPLSQVFIKGTIIEKGLAHTKIKFKYIRRKQYRRTHFEKLSQTFIRINSIELMEKVDNIKDDAVFKERVF